MRTYSSIPFADRPTCTVVEACQASGLGRTKLYEAMSDGRLESVKIDNRRLVCVPSLLKLLAVPDRVNAA
jgi:hypothetical protein